MTVGQESGRGLVKCLCLTGLWSRHHRLGLHSLPRWGCKTSSLSHEVVGRIHFLLTGCWTEGLSCSLSVGGKPHPSLPGRPFIRQLPEWKLASLRASKTARASVQGGSRPSLSQAITLHLLCWQDTVRWEQVARSVWIHRGELHHGMHPREQGHWGRSWAATLGWSAALSVHARKGSPFHGPLRPHKRVMLGLMSRHPCYVVPWTPSGGRETWLCGTWPWWKKKSTLDSPLEKDNLVQCIYSCQKAVRIILL